MANLRVDKITSTETFETTGSVQFSVNVSSALEISASDDFSFGTGDFTIEAWVYSRAIFGSDQIISLSDGTQNWQFFHHSTGVLRWNSRGTNDGGTSAYNASEGMESDRWYHVAVSLESGILRLFKDGKNIGTHTHNSDLTFSGGGPSIGIWDGDLTSEAWRGNISNLRVIKGKALYTEDFTPPTRELEVTPETVLLCCQHKTDATYEKTDKTITVTGDAVASELTPGLLTDVVKSGGSSAITGSVEFGESDYLTLASSSDFNLGTGDFTIEFWIHPQKRFTSFPTIFEIDATDNANRLLINFRNTSTLGLTSGTTVFATNAGFDLDEWYHIAVVRESGVSRIYKNGITGGDTACTADFSNSGSSNVFIGWDSTITSTEKYNGFISNLRLVKGTALYTDNFIPPTRDLKKVPGTVLLCCQDSNDPTTEATGKTITGFGDLDQVYNTQLVPNGDFSDGTNNWTGETNGVLSVSSGQLTITNTGGSNGRATGSAFKTTIGARYILKYDAITTGGSYRAEIREANGGGAEQAFESTTDGATETFEFQATHARHSVVLYSIGGDTITTTYDNVSVYKVNPGKTGSNFTPQVGNDGSVEFVGPTKINTENYFYLPTGDTESRYPIGANTIGNNRAIFSSGTTPGATNTVDYITISSKGDAQDFGGMGQTQGAVGTVSDSTRGIFAGGQNPVDNRIEYITISSTGDAKDFGDMTRANRFVAGAGNAIRGCLGGGLNSTNTIDYITIQSMGNAFDFGDLVSARGQCSGLASPTRGIFAGGHAHPSPSNSVQVIDFISIMSTGNAQDFGDLINNNSEDQAGASNEVRGLIAGGSPAGNANQEVIQYITIASTGDATDFGNLVVGATSKGGAASPTRAVFAGGYTNPGTTMTAAMDFVTITSTGNAQDFGDLTVARDQLNGLSNGHGGLG